MRGSSINRPAGVARFADSAAREALASGLLTLLCLAAATVALQHTTVLPARSVPTVVGAFALALTVLVLTIPRHHPHRRFGAANRVTLVRTAMAALLVGCVGAGKHPMLVWCVVGIATLAACLDALDGRLARRQGTASTFGARFDMEADAALIMVLSLLAWQFDKAGAWVVAAGLMRYAFVLAGCLLPWMRVALPASGRRQGACVMQVVALIACIVPVVPVPWSAAIAALGLGALSASFLIDIAWLAREARRAR